MMRLADLIAQFEPELLARHGPHLLPSHRQALGALKTCRTRFAPHMLAACSGCHTRRCLPHSCGHRACPHCQHFESQAWLQRQLKALVPATYFLVTFTLPALDLFSHKALGKVFAAKVRAALADAGFTLPAGLPERWVVDCKAVGDGQAALRYLGRYLCRGVISERDILRCKDGMVTFRYRDAQSGKIATRTLPGADFVWLLLQHILPKGFVRARNFGFLHHNSRRSLRLRQVLHLRPSAAPPPTSTSPRRPVWPCACGGAMVMVRRRLHPDAVPPCAAPQTKQPDKAYPVEAAKH